MDAVTSSGCVSDLVYGIAVVVHANTAYTLQLCGCVVKIQFVGNSLNARDNCACFITATSAAFPVSQIAEAFVVTEMLFPNNEEPND
jgi:hypothetical protein